MDMGEIVRTLVFRKPGSAMDYLNVVNVNEKMDRGETLMHIAVILRDTEIASALLSLKANVNITDDNGNTPLSNAIDLESPELLELLLKHSPDFDMEIVREKFYSSLLSTYIDDEKSVMLMVKYGFTFKSSDSVNSTILWSFISLGFEEMAIAAVECNSDLRKIIDVWHRSFLLHTQPFNESQTEIFRIITKMKNLLVDEKESKWSGNRNTDLFKILLSESDTELINVNIMSRSRNFDHNDESDIVEIVKVILLSCYNANQPVCDDRGRTALHWAAKVGNIAVIQNLLDLHADINAQDNAGKTPLHYAFERICEFSSEDSSVTSNDEKQYDSEFNCWMTLLDLKIGALVMLKHVSKLITLNCYINLENLKVVKSLLIMMSKDEIVLPYYMSVYRLIENCEYEVNLMKEKKVVGISYFDFLTKDCDKIAFYTKRSEVFETFWLNNDILSTFEIYGPMLQHQYQMCNARRNLIEKAEVVLYDILKWIQMPVAVVREILCNFSNEDLFFFLVHSH